LPQQKPAVTRRHPTQANSKDAALHTFGTNSAVVATSLFSMLTRSNGLLKNLFPAIGGG
jgi:hypothetical protein